MARPGEPICFRHTYGSNVIPQSCNNAWDKIDRSLVPKRYALRSKADEASFDYSTPFRYLSDDGLCAIDIVIPQESKTGRVSGWGHCKWARNIPSRLGRLEQMRDKTLRGREREQV
ncbi:MAG: hypothetical protein Q9186_000668 [Xanthomendoza sp. 1 TL-2023]